MWIHSKQCIDTIQTYPQTQISTKNAKAEEITNDKTKRGTITDCAVIESTGRNFRKYYPYSSVLIVTALYSVKYVHRQSHDKQDYHVCSWSCEIISMQALYSAMRVREAHARKSWLPLFDPVDRKSYYRAENACDSILLNNCVYL